MGDTETPIVWFEPIRAIYISYDDMGERPIRILNGNPMAPQARAILSLEQGEMTLSAYASLTNRAKDYRPFPPDHLAAENTFTIERPEPAAIEIETTSLGRVKSRFLAAR